MTTQYTHTATRSTHRTRNLDVLMYTQCRYPLTIIKWCNGCHKYYPTDNFNKAPKNKGCSLGLVPKCKACVKKYREDNKERISSANKEYKRKHKERYKENRLEYIDKNRDGIYAYNAHRRSLHKSHMPPWADVKKIRAVYERTAQIRRLGLKVEVDHTVPLVSDKVCGFHCESNLEIIYAKDNSSKSNRWWPEDFEHQYQTSVYGDVLGGMI